MCKASDGSHARGRVLACMRHLKGRMPSGLTSGQAGEEGGNGEPSGDTTMEEGPILRILSSDVLAEACCMLDIKSLGRASATCSVFRDVCQGRYPWRLLCMKEWGMTENNIGIQEKGKLPRQRNAFHDSILGADFRRLFPLIEHMPSGFDCSTLLPRGCLPDDKEGEIISRNFCVKGLVKRGQDGRSPGVQDRETVIAVQVEYRGGIGIGNRCVRADHPLPSTILRDRKSFGVKSHLAQQMAASPLAIFRWFLAKMAAGGGGVSGGVYRGGIASTSALNPPLTVGAGIGDAEGNQDYQAAAAAVEVGDGMVQEAAMINGLGDGSAGGDNHLAGVGAIAGASDGFGERLRRASSMPLASWCSGGANSNSSSSSFVNRGREEILPSPVCFPVALGGDMVDVTPRLVSYFEVAIGSPRLEHQHAIPDCIAVGVSKSAFPLSSKMPGWDARSYGYHSDDGGAFHDAGSMLFKCGPSFGPGDVVGCGLDYSVGDDSADIFFTLNGRSLGNIFQGVRGSFYPTVGIDSHCPVRINVGTEPFAFDLAEALRKGGQESAALEAVAQLEPFAFSTTPSNTPSPEGASSTRGEDRPRQHSGPLPRISPSLIGSRGGYSEIALRY